MSTYLPDSKIAANAHRIYHILDSNLDVKADVPLATVGSVLHRAGITATLRDTRGQDIDGACGQLAAKER